MTFYFRVKKLIVQGIPADEHHTLNIEGFDKEGKPSKLNSLKLNSQSKYQNSDQYYTALSAKQKYQLSIVNNSPISVPIDFSNEISSFKGNKDTLLNKIIKISSKISADVQYRYDKHRAIVGGSSMAIPNLFYQTRSQYKVTQKHKEPSAIVDYAVGQEHDGRANVPKNINVRDYPKTASTPPKLKKESSGFDTGFKEEEVDQRMDRNQAKKSESKHQIQKVTETKPKTQKVAETKPKDKVMPIFLGACQNKNFFSCLDAKVEDDTTFSIVEPTYR